MNPDSEQKKPQETLQQPPNNHFWHATREWIQVIIIALVIAIPVRWFIAEPFIVNGASMDPTFATNQFLIVDRLTYDFSQPKRGDVIVFQYPDSGPGTHIPTTYYIKRIIVLPGESFSIKNGHVFVANAADPKGFYVDDSFVAPDHASYDNISTTTMDATHYFVMGDNRAQSSDSRSWGPLDRRFIIGRPIIRLLPINMVSFLPGEEHL
jgi:signal peptidase I